MVAEQDLNHRIADVLADIVDEATGRVEVLAVVTRAYARGDGSAGDVDLPRLARELDALLGFLSVTVDERLAALAEAVH